MKKSFFLFKVSFLIAAFLAGIYLFSGCKKNVGVITSILRYDVSGYVSDTQSSALAGVEIFMDGASVATTDQTGKYTISKLLTGKYLVEAKKSGYTKGRFSLVVTDAGAATSAMALKQLAPAVAVNISGGTIAGTSSSGATSAAITVPAGTLSAPVQISVTTLVGNEAPKYIAVSNKAPGVIVSIDCSDPTITFPNGITLTFNLPFTQRPGSAMQVVTYNETTNQWVTFTDAIVSNDGKSAHVTIYHFSIWGVNVPLTFTHQDVSISAPVITPYTASIEWSSMLDFKEGTPAEIDDYSILYGKVESSTGLSFASYQISGTLSTISTVKNRISITEASASNPAGFGTFAPRNWELVKYIYTVKGTISFPIFDIASNMDVLKNVNCWYEMPAFVWLWRPDETFTVPTNPALAHDVVTITPIILGTQHQGGSGS